MKVQGPTRPRMLPLRDTQNAKETPDKAAVSARGEKVQVSSSSKLLADAKGPEVKDSARIERLKGAIKDGSFKVDPQRIASAMIAEETA
jgi:negative regulator of flagellin synthesis FlgM